MLFHKLTTDFGIPHILGDVRELRTHLAAATKQLSSSACSVSCTYDASKSSLCRTLGHRLRCVPVLKEQDRISTGVWAVTKQAASLD
jgi:hypothetical protein